jgi:hypothetical protein
MADHVVGEMKTVVIEWVEESQHKVTVRVPVDFNHGDCDLHNALAEFSDVGFEFVERAVVAVRDVAADPSAEFFNPPRYEGAGV